ncbi:H-2 class I histocompatibility antigen, Q9 alpha chain-like isoform X2 [Boleophthalmus pectinirostris]|uniref:H-2 class I histocompatibility antigen, Q9 alpha chain-like isoform X2 n=1 Tax=Boleophthalmus pectinirostris TaxID=150288 RepID=UPI0024315D62|nr:H-2 class I histocompatibility antigen, Q9 alpha chain-like isoform X2 [Boleophthalmus pectinirostris]
MGTFFVFTLLALGVHDAVAVIHSLKYFYTASRGIPSFPEFVTVGLVNNQPISYYDSTQRREVPKQEWMKQTEEAEYWDKQTKISMATEKQFKASIDTVSQRLNQTKGPHIVQNMYGCEWDDETGKVNGFNQFGYNGEDYIAFNLETETWIAPKPEAMITKMKWDRDEAKIQKDKTYLTHVCVEWLKKYLEFGKQSLMRTVLPSIYLLQKSFLSPVTCHATGFYPDRAMLFWTKDGVELFEGVDPGEILPNHDGTFQVSTELDMSAVPSGDWGRYNCVFQLSGVKEDIITQLDKESIRSNEKKMQTPSIL